MMNAIHQDTNLWEVWIEFDQSHPEFFGTLYVHGEVSSDKKSFPSLIRMDSNDGQLHLQLPDPSTSYRYTEEVLYSEPIRNLNQYTSVYLYSENELIGHFNEIEIMI